jgi:hypothetical protein
MVVGLGEWHGESIYVSFRRSLIIMSMSIDPLRKTTQELHRFWFSVNTEKQWYNIIREARQWFGKDWKSQSKVKRKLAKQTLPFGRSASIMIWFDVPDVGFATWISVKYSIQAQSDAKFNAGK